VGPWAVSWPWLSQFVFDALVLPEPRVPGGHAPSTEPRPLDRERVFRVPAAANGGLAFGRALIPRGPRARRVRLS
jgi:hypothetical protein